MPDSQPIKKVMISSTSRDLPRHREQSISGILRVKMLPLAMEHLGALTGDAIDVSLEMVDDADIYVGIFARRYGHVPDDEVRNPKEISITEMEYRRAVTRGIPILIFLMDDDHPIPTSAKEAETFFEASEEGKEKLKTLKEKLLDDHVVAFFTSPEDLRAHLIQSLPKLSIKKSTPPPVPPLTPPPEDEPIKGTDDTIPHPPELYSVPKYIQTGQFIGRKRELDMFDTWTQSDDPLMIVSAIGGQGKSAVTWHWVNQYAHKHDFEGVMWWSFYERGATMNAFMRHALAYIEGENPDDAEYNNMHHHDRKTRLIALLQRKRYLIVLDGLERILTAYHRLDKAQVRDDQVDSDLRACTDPKDSDVLYELAGSQPSKILVSTRLVPRIYEAPSADYIGGVQVEKLAGLDPTDAENLLIADQVTFTDKRLLHEFLNKFGYHGLLVRMIAGRIKKDFRSRKHFDTWYARHGKNIDLASMDIKQRRSNILEYTMAGLDDETVGLLNRIAAFNEGVNIDTLTVVNPFATLDKFDRALEELVDCGLLQRDPDIDHFDLHPVVRGYAFANLQGDEKVNTFNSIHDHFESQEYGFDDIAEMEQLQIPITIYRALIGAGRLDDAADFFMRALGDSLYFDLIAYPIIVQLLKPLFVHELDKPPLLQSKSSQSWIMNGIAIAYRNSGNSQSTIQLLELVFKIDLDIKNVSELMARLANYGDVEHDANQLYRQFQAYTLHQEFALVISNKDEIAASYTELFNSHMLRGDWENADSAWQRSEDFDYYNAGLNNIWRAQMLIVQDQDAEPMLKMGLELAKVHPWPRAIMVAYGLYIIHFIQQSDLEQAVHYAKEAITLARRSGSFRLAQYLGRLARVRAKQGRYDEALSLIDEAWRGAVIEFDKAELYNCATEVYRAMGDTTKAKENAINAYTIAWVDGPPYANHWQLEQAKAHLNALGVKYPDMPAFNADNQDPLPYEDEMRAYLEELRQAKDDDDI